jgi:hypothetical protein
MKKLYSEEYETWTEEANKIAFQFSSLIKDFITEKMEEYSSIELENVIQSEITMIFAFERINRNHNIVKQKYKDSIVEALEIEQKLLSKDKEKYLEILQNRSIMDRMNEAGITLESSVENIYRTRLKDVHKGILLAKRAYNEMSQM